MEKYFFFLILYFGFASGNLAQSAKIKGRLTFPGEWIPAELVLCVKPLSLKSGNIHCSNESASRLRHKNKIKFSLNYPRATFLISLPPGKYYVFATFPPGKAPTRDLEGIRAFYNEFVKCGISIHCKSKKKIAVILKEGQMVDGITVGDWW